MIISEITRRNLVGKTKAQSPQRFNKRLGYKALGYKGVDINGLLTDDTLACEIPVGDYVCTIAYQGVLEKLKEVLKKQPRPNVTLQSVIRAVTQAFDDTDVLIDCTCPDFIYRYAYWATKYGYKYGKPETRKPEKTNPDDNEGAACKHLTSILANKRWLVKVASVVNEYIRAYPDQVRKVLGLSEDEFIVNVPGRPRKSAEPKKPRDIPRKDNPPVKDEPKDVDQGEEAPDEDQLEPDEPTNDEESEEER